MNSKGISQYLMLATLLAATPAVLVAQLPAAKQPTLAAGESDPSQAASAAERVREGTKIVQASGEFQATGERIHFVSESMPPLKVLENLALERVAQALSERSAGREWTVSGVVTEYRGVNYLLLTRASLKTRRADQ
jgi:hypothetical protein